MTIFPVIIDSRPRPLGQPEESLSLLTLPIGGGILLDLVMDSLVGAAREKPIIAPAFMVDDRYRARFAEHGDRIARIVEDNAAQLAYELEPSDVLLVIDPRCFPIDGIRYSSFLHDIENMRGARHKVALDRSHGGTREFLQFDAEGRVRRIQRYYEGHTWLQTQSVAASLIPVSSLWDIEAPPLTDLPRLRRTLSATGAFSRDFPLESASVDLRTEAGMVHLLEHRLMPELGPALPQSYREVAPQVWVAQDAQVAENTRLYGPLIVQPGARIEEQVVLIGPSVVGAGACVGPRATLAKSWIAQRALVAADTVANRRVLVSAVQGRLLAEDHDFVPVRSALPVNESRLDPRRKRYMRGKAVVEAVVAAVGLLLLSPIMLATALAVKLTSRGPIFFGHDREGLQGKLFKCLKFRTMIADAQALERALARQQNEVDGPQFKLKHDPRVTLVGRFLRASNLDELPQLFNVLRGQMSLIGPRPSPFRENQICVPWRLARLSVRPGISGLWQICRHDRESGDFHQWIYYDTMYVRHLSFWLDLKILLATVLTLGGRFSVPLDWIVAPRRREAGSSGGPAATTPDAVATLPIMDSKTEALPS